EGEDGEATVEVESDPVAVVADPGSGLAFVANRTSHSISVLDTTTSPIEILSPWTEQLLTQARFTDSDQSGSTGSMTTLDTIEDTVLTDDTWTLSWIEGTWRLWLPDADGLWRVTTTGDESYAESGLGIELAIEDSDDEVIEITDPDYLAGTQGRMFFADQGTIRAAGSGSSLADWAFETDVLLEGGEWDASVGGPSVILDEDEHYLFYDGTDGTDWGIGLAISSDGLEFSAVADPILTPTWDHEIDRISDPYVVWDSQIDRWRMYYSAFDGSTWSIGHATSPDLETWTTDEEPVLSLAGEDAAAPVISVEQGSFRMWFTRRTHAPPREGEQAWSLGTATSVDGFEWTDTGSVLELGITGDEPPGAALNSSPSSSFRVTGEHAGHLRGVLTPGELWTAATWEARVVTGYQVGTHAAGSTSSLGIQLDTILPDAGLAW
ncbi:MAG: hypothetical protein QGG40_20855, partial [Myxococcota bacterium]|nr:hypothetical protein [Myxococcota bacterium]